MARSWQSGAFAEFRTKLDYSEYGGAPLLGLKGVSIICHGRSNANAIKNAVRVAAEFAEGGVSEKIEAELDSSKRSLENDETRLAIIVCALVAAGSLWAQKKDPVQWTLSSELPAAPPGTIVPLRFTATIQPGWHIYSLTLPENAIPRPSKVTMGENAALEFV